MLPVVVGRGALSARRSSLGAANDGDDDDGSVGERSAGAPSRGSGLDSELSFFPALYF